MTYGCPVAVFEHIMLKMHNFVRTSRLVAAKNEKKKGATNATKCINEC